MVTIPKSFFSGFFKQPNWKRFKEPDVGKGNNLVDKSFWKIQILLKNSSAKESKTQFKNENLDETPEAVKVCVFFSKKIFSKAD